MMLPLCRPDYAKRLATHCICSRCGFVFLRRAPTPLFFTAITLAPSHTIDTNVSALPQDTLTQCTKCITGTVSLVFTVKHLKT